MNNRNSRLLLISVGVFLFFMRDGNAQSKPKPPVPPIEAAKGGGLIYNPDSLGNRIADFSYCGYMSGNMPIPNAPIRVIVPVKNGDATLRIQSAINYVASLPVDKNGLRGAVLLEKGSYEVQGNLFINASGVVLRGSGMGAGGTVLIGAGTDRETLIKVFKKSAKDGDLSQTGIENMLLRSAYDTNNPKDEAHRWMAISMENVNDAWVRQVVFKHFAGSAVALLETSSRITVEDCKSLNPVSEIGAFRRNTFYTLGKQTLFQRIYAEYGYHDFAVGNTPEGPNAFVQCESFLPFSYSGTIEGVAEKVLFDIVKVDGNALGFPFTERRSRGASNSVLWQCTAARVDCFQSSEGPNNAFGTWASYSGNGGWYYNDEHIQPRSLYYAQLTERIGKKAMERAWLLDMGSEASSSPTIEKATELTAQAREPLLELKDWIDQVVLKQPIPTQANGVKSIDQISLKDVIAPPTGVRMELINGRLMRWNNIVTGNRHQVSWWRGGFSEKDLNEAKPHITRYVPGRTGTGFTDNLEDVTNWMADRKIVAIDHNYGLWYDRRRDDHERIRRMDGEVKAPFYELPFARSGQGTAWDGLSKYDLTKYNSWYWTRLREFADLADKKGLILLHQNYFQHNIIEAGAHYADFPWRPANNINNTPFVEPVHYAGDKRIFYADQFYDLSNPAYRELHRAYIRKCLDNFKGNKSVIQLVSAEYTGPLHFVEFWLDVIGEWEKETGIKQLIALSTTKDVQDAILADKKRAAIVNIIDIRYWYYQSTGDEYAPAGGKNLAPRQHARQMKSKGTSFEQVYRAVREYRVNNPQKAVIYSSESYDKLGWAVFMGGGSLPVLPSIEQAGFLNQAATMQPVGTNSDLSGDLLLADPGKGYIVYTRANSVQLDLSQYSSQFTIYWIDPQTGRNIVKPETVKGGKTISLNNPGKTSILWATATK